LSRGKISREKHSLKTLAEVGVQHLGVFFSLSEHETLLPCHHFTLDVFSDTGIAHGIV
jgi:hypothetical protein